MITSTELFLLAFGLTPVLAITDYAIASESSFNKSNDPSLMCNESQ